METEIPCAPAWKQPFPTGGHGNGMESISNNNPKKTKSQAAIFFFLRAAQIAT
jgi:hypothetical protein